MSVYSEIIEPADIGVGYMGGSLFVGGKNETTKRLQPKEKVALMRKDIKRLQKMGLIPADWKVRIRTDGYLGNWTACVTVETCRPFESVPSYEEFHDAKAGSPTKRAGIAVMESLGGSCTRSTYEQKRKELREDIRNGWSGVIRTRWGDSRCVMAKTVETVEAENTIRAACAQYTYSDTNAMVDYFDTDGYVRIDFYRPKCDD